STAIFSIAVAATGGPWALPRWPDSARLAYRPLESSMANASLSAQDAERLRRFERQRHDSLAATYQDFFTPITTLAIEPLLDAAGASAGSNLLDIATGPGSVAAKARSLGAACIGVDLSPGMIALARTSHPDIDFRVAEVEHLPFADQSFDAIACN